MFWAIHLVIFTLKTVQSFRGSNTVSDLIPKFGSSNTKRVFSPFIAIQPFDINNSGKVSLKLPLRQTKAQV